MTEDFATDDALLDVPLVPDSNIDQELAGDVAAIADEDLKGCRLLIVRRAVEPIVIDGARGGLVKVGVSFQPTHCTRFVWAQIVIALGQPEDTVFVDIAPDTKIDRPVKFTVDASGKLNAGYEAAGLKAGVNTKTTTKFEVYHCAVHGTGAGTTKGRWEFEENPERKDGLGREQSLLMTLKRTGRVTGNVSAYAKILRSGILGGIDAMAHLIIGADERHAPLRIDIPSV